MIVEYIGQGLYDEENYTCGNHICSALNSDFFTDMNFFVAFLRRTGLFEIIKFLKKAKDKGKNITFYVGIDQKVTSRQALEKLLELNIPTYVYNSSSYIYHPKVYMFEGKDKNRVIIGSSNFTNNGLFNNVEASVLLDFTSLDKSGMKFLNQVKDYFSPLLEFNDPNITEVTQEYIQELSDKGLLSNEDFDSETGTYNTKENFDSPKKRNKDRNTGELGTIVISENDNHGIKNKQKLKITEDYLAKWPIMFEKLKAYKNKFNSTVVSKNYEDRTLQGWYQKQKLIHNSPDIEMPLEHYEKLLELDIDFFKDGHIKLQENTIERWLEILEEALKSGENVKANHRYIFGEHRLGTWLVGIASANKKGRRLDVREKIEKLGFDYSKTSRDLKSVVARLIKDLYSVENPDRQRWRTRLFKYIGKKENLKPETIQEIEFAWKYHFHDDFSWDKIHEKYSDNTDEWKQHRNETGQWYPIKIIEGRYQNLYTWVERRLVKPSILKKNLDRFNEVEKQELRDAGFKI
ncbi:MAG: phospholipase D family protein [Sphingobacteriales bacterium]|nr:phospholipase D family protein [Sphingobacteriales bacterium]